jgi:hypothetical protein
LREHVIPEVHHYNSWWDFRDRDTGKIATRRLDRDWTKEELLEIASLDTETGFVHNHQISWCKETVKAFNDNDWLTFMFIRDPRDVLCSLYFWSQNQQTRFTKEELRTPLMREVTAMSGQSETGKVTMNTFIDFFITDQHARRLWVLPDYTENIEYVAEFTDKNFGQFLKSHFLHVYVPQEKRNTSASKGYDFYYRNGHIAESTNRLLVADPEFLKYNNYIDL